MRKGITATRVERDHLSDIYDLPHTEARTGFNGSRQPISAEESSGSRSGRVCGMASFRVMTWRGIPAQVQATDDSGASVSVQLPPFFQQEIDRVAMREGLMDTDEYLEGWAWSESVERDGTAEDVVESVAEEVAEEWRRTSSDSGSRQARVARSRPE